MKIAVLAVVVPLVFLSACNSQPKPDQTLAALPETERAALEAICKAAGTEPAKLRDVGFVADFRDERNRQAIAIRNGHVHTLGLAKTTFTQPPDFSAFTGLEALWLEEGALQSWPDLSKLSHLKSLHLNGQPLGTPPPNLLPRQLETLDLARTNIADLAFLAGFFNLRKLDVSGTKVDSIDPIMDSNSTKSTSRKRPFDRCRRDFPQTVRGNWISRKPRSRRFRTSQSIHPATNTRPAPPPRATPTPESPKSAT